VSGPGLLIVGHGTVDPDGVAEFLAFADRVRERATELEVGAGFIELARPAVSAAVDTWSPAGPATSSRCR
jgi:sirohydrochlorin cobaltochelatase